MNYTITCCHPLTRVKSELLNISLVSSISGFINLYLYRLLTSYLRLKESSPTPTICRLTLPDPTHWLSSLLAVVMSACMVSFFAVVFVTTLANKK